LSFLLHFGTKEVSFFLHFRTERI